MDNNLLSNFVLKRVILASLLVALLVEPMSAQPGPDPPLTRCWAIALHGGAASRSKEMGRDERQSLERSLRRALTAGKTILSAGGPALDAVETVVRMLEDDPQFNAGRGAVFTWDGTHELDASIMDGATLRNGAVASIKYQKNPITAARLVMERTPHVLLAGEGADSFAAENGGQQVAQNYFYTDRRFRELQIALANAGHEPPTKPAYPVQVEPQATDHPGLEGGGGTVGCVALDQCGHLAAATSTGGLTGKLTGRIGDTPICGAGNYANNKSCAVSCTGKGEEFIRHSIASRVAWLVGERRHSVDEAVRYCLNTILHPGDGGIIAVDRQGHITMRATTGAMPCGAADSAGRFETAIWVGPCLTTNHAARHMKE